MRRSDQRLAALFLFMSVILSSLSSCTKQQELKNQLEGTWNIEEYSGNGQSRNSKAEDLQATFNATDAGQLTFEGDGTGQYQFDYKVDIAGVAAGSSVSTTIAVSSSGKFDWDNAENTVTITYTSGEREGEEDRYDVDNSGDEQQEWSGESEQEHNFAPANSAVFE
ncbi:MAG: hypothetical protein BRD50_01635, partial [Bacteroidetes bacterium SW_11_45_7]